MHKSAIVLDFLGHCYPKMRSKNQAASSQIPSTCIPPDPTHGQFTQCQPTNVIHLLLEGSACPFLIIVLTLFPPFLIVHDNLSSQVKKEGTANLMSSPAWTFIVYLCFHCSLSSFLACLLIVPELWRGKRRQKRIKVKVRWWVMIHYKKWKQNFISASTRWKETKQNTGCEKAVSGELKVVCFTTKADRILSSVMPKVWCLSLSNELANFKVKCKVALPFTVVMYCHYIEFTQPDTH